MPLALSLVAVLAISAAVWALLWTRPGMQGLAAGFVAGVGVAFLYHWSVISSGAASTTMGQAAEGWTDSELRLLHRKGWRHVTHLIVKEKSGDVDHVAVGPDGVLVIETKWRSADIAVDHPTRWMRDAVWQAKRNRDDVRMLLKWRERDERPIEAVVVWWGPAVSQESDEPVLVDGVNVLAGHRLRDELAHLSDLRLQPDEIDEIYGKLKERIAKRDEWEAENSAPLPPTLGAQATRWAWKAGAAWLGLLLSLLTLNLGWWSFAAIGVLVAVGLGLRPVERWRSEATWFLVGVAAMVPVVLIAALWAG
jgi:hypothetical protein